MNEYLDWKVGDEVVCISHVDYNCYSMIDILPIIGIKYSIRRIGIDNISGVLAIQLNEIINQSQSYNNIPRYECAFAVKHFRKVQKRKTDISVFKEMLNKTPSQNNKELLESELKELIDA